MLSLKFKTLKSPFHYLKHLNLQLVLSQKGSVSGIPYNHQACFSSPQVGGYQSQYQMGGSRVFIQPQCPLVDSPFWVAFLFGNVSRCNGCKGKISHQIDNKPLPPPNDLILGHKEYVIFLNHKSGHGISRMYTIIQERLVLLLIFRL